MTLLQFNVLASSKIRRKKPWRRVEWIGREKESICLINKKRLSLLYLPSGRTKRVFRDLKPYMKDILLFKNSLSGEYSVALLSSGNLIRWHKDASKVVQIEVYPGFALSGVKDLARANVFVSDDGEHILLFFDSTKIYVWDQISSPLSVQFGEWSSISLNQNSLTSLEFKTIHIDVLFFVDQNGIQCCNCTFVGKNGFNLCVFSVLIHWKEELHKSIPDSANFITSSSFCTLPICTQSPTAQSARTWSTGGCRISHDGCLLAIGINNYRSKQSFVMFLNLSSHPFLPINSKKLGFDNFDQLSEGKKMYWIADMSWTHDNLFLSCITKCGCLFLLTKMGELMMISNHSPEYDNKSSYFLSLLPIVYDKKNVTHDETLIDEQNSSVSTVTGTASHKSGRQHYSITTHPRLHVILCSDGYRVIILQMVDIVRSYDLAFISMINVHQELNMLIKRFNLKATSTDSLDYQPTLLIENQLKLKENKYVLMFLDFKAKFNLSKRESLQHKKKSQTDEENLPADENVMKLADKLKEEEQELEADTLRTESVQSNIDGKRETKASVKFSLPKPRFVDGRSFASLLDESILDAGTGNVDGESLFYSISHCVSKILHTWGLIISEHSIDSFVVEVNPLCNEVFLCFLHTLHFLCDVIMQSQHVLDCLPWNGSETHLKSKKRTSNRKKMFSDTLKKLTFQLCALATWSNYKSQYVLKSLEVAISFVLRLNDFAPEGCMCVKDIAQNTSAALCLLRYAESCFKKANRCQLIFPLINSNTLTNEQFEMVDGLYLKIFELTKSHTMKLSPVWNRLYEYVTQVHSSEMFFQLHPTILKIMMFLQRLFFEMNFAENIELCFDVDSSSALMMTNLRESNFTDALSLAAVILGNCFKYKWKWNEHHWHAIESLCSVMAFYFSSQAIYFPSSVLTGRPCFVERELVTTAIRKQNLSQIWNADLTLSFLLSCGRMHEASTFAYKIGAWRVALAICAVAEKTHISTASPKKSRRESLFAEEKLTVCGLLQSRFLNLLPECISKFEEVTMDLNCKLDDSTLRLVEMCFDFQPDSLYMPFVDIFTIAVMTGYDISSWAAEHILSLLKKVCLRISLIIDDTFYLPAPPLYLPQPTPDLNAEMSTFISLRVQSSNLVRILLVLFNSIGLTELATTWYITQCQDAADELRSALNENLENVSFHNVLNSNDGKVLVLIFQETCDILWMLHIQEQLNMLLRKYQKQRENCDQPEECRTTILDCLRWAKKMMPFVKYMDCETDLQNLVLCLCSELEVDVSLAEILAQFFYDLENVNPKIKSRHMLLEAKMRHVLVPIEAASNGIFEEDVNFVNTNNNNNSGNNTQPLSVYYHQCCDVGLTLHKRKKKKQKYVGESHHVNDFKNNEFQYDFLSQFFDVILNKTTSYETPVKFSTKNRKNRHFHAILTLSNRHNLAVKQLEIAAEKLQNTLAKVAEQDLLFNLKHNASRLNEETYDENFNTLPKSHSLSPSVSLQSYFSNHLNKHNIYLEEGTHLSNPILLEWPLLGITDAPEGRQKRFERLLPYMNWLQHWSQMELKGFIQTIQPSICLHVTKQQLLHAALVAEARFGKESIAFQRKPSGQSTTLKHIVSDKNVHSRKYDGSLQENQSEEDDHKNENQGHIDLFPLSSQSFVSVSSVEHDMSNMSSKTSSEILSVDKDSNVEERTMALRDREAPCSEQNKEKNFGEISQEHGDKRSSTVFPTTPAEVASINKDHSLEEVHLALGDKEEPYSIQSKKKTMERTSQEHVDTGLRKISVESSAEVIPESKGYSLERLPVSMIDREEPYSVQSKEKKLDRISQEHVDKCLKKISVESSAEIIPESEGYSLERVPVSLRDREEPYSVQSNDKSLDRISQEHVDKRLRNISLERSAEIIPENKSYSLERLPGSLIDREEPYSVQSQEQKLDRISQEHVDKRLRKISSSAEVIPESEDYSFKKVSLSLIDREEPSSVQSKEKKLDRISQEHVDKRLRKLSAKSSAEVIPESEDCSLEKVSLSLIDREEPSIVQSKEKCLGGISQDHVDKRLRNISLENSAGAFPKSKGYSLERLPVSLINREEPHSVQSKEKKSDRISQEHVDKRLRKISVESSAEVKPANDDYRLEKLPVSLRDQEEPYSVQNKEKTLDILFQEHVDKRLRKISAEVIPASKDYSLKKVSVSLGDSEEPYSVHSREKKLDRISEEHVDKLEQIREMQQNSPIDSQQTSLQHKVTEVVRSEIQNVLLAQQVSLLSQILLGQSQNLSHPGNLLAQVANLQHPTFTSQMPFNTQSQEKCNSDDQKHVDVKTQTSKEALYSTQTDETVEDRKDKFGIPLFQIEGISKLPQPKWATRIDFPQTRKNQTASGLSKQTRSLLHHKPMQLLDCSLPENVLTKDLASYKKRADLMHKNQKHTSPKHEHHTVPTVRYNLKDQHFPSNYNSQRNMKSVDKSLSGNMIAHKSPIKTCNIEPSFHKLTSTTTTHVAWPNIANKSAKPDRFFQYRPTLTCAVTKIERGIIPCLINPAEVLEHQNKRQNFQPIKRIGMTTTKTVLYQPSVPLLKGPQFVFEAPLQKQQVPATSDNEKVDMQFGKRDQASLPQVASKDTKGSFPSDLPREHEQHVDKDVTCKHAKPEPVDILPASQVHFTAAMMKHIPSKPRMKDAQSQVEELATKENIIDMNRNFSAEKIVNETLQSPKNRYQQIRFHQDTKTSPESEFLHIGETEINEVMQGLRNQQPASEIRAKSITFPSDIVSPFAGFDNNVIDGAIPPTTTTNAPTILSSHVQAAIEIKEVRGETHNRWMSAMNHMSAQLDAMNVMAQRMDVDFKESKKLVEVLDVVENASMTSSTSGKRHQKPITGYHASPSVHSSNTQSLVSSLRQSRESNNNSMDESRMHMNHHSTNLLQNDASYVDPNFRQFVITDSETGFPKKHEDWTKIYRSRLKEAHKLASSMEDNTTAAPMIHEYDSDINVSFEDVSINSSSVNEAQTYVGHAGSSSTANSAIIARHQAQRKPKKQRGKENVADKEYDHWMTDKKQVNVFKRDRMTKLTTAERKPYDSSKRPTNSNRLLKLQKQREADRMQRLANNMSRRLDDSMKLLEEMNSDITNTPRPSKRTPSKSKHTSGHARPVLREQNTYTKSTAALHTKYSNRPPYRVEKEISMESTGNFSDASILSSWELNDDVRRILYGTNKQKPRGGKVTFDLEDTHQDLLRNDVESNFDRESCDTRSLLSSVDWNSIDALTASVKPS